MNRREIDVSANLLCKQTVLGKLNVEYTTQKIARGWIFDTVRDNIVVCGSCIWSKEQFHYQIKYILICDFENNKYCIFHICRLYVVYPKWTFYDINCFSDIFQIFNIFFFGNVKGI